jgi:hypothetical protein
VRIRFIAALTALITIGQLNPAMAWELSVPSDNETVVRTYFNPAYGPFDIFTLPKNDKKSWDIQNYGVFFLNVYCSEEKYAVVTKYQKWDDVESTWKTIPYLKSPSFSLKFGSSKAIPWGTRVEEGVDGVVISNPKLFIKKLSAAKSLSFPTVVEQTKYSVKFNTAGFAKYLPDLSDAGC